MMNTLTKLTTALDLSDVKTITGGLFIAKYPFPFDPCPFPGPITDPIDPSDIPPVFYL